MALCRFSSTIDSIPENAVERFRQHAEQVLADKAPVDAVASLLAMLLGQTKVLNHSLISSSQVGLIYC